MKILPENEELLRKAVRNAIAINPTVSIRRMQKIVEKNVGRAISDKYASKLMHKVKRQAIIESDRSQINVRLAEMKDRFRMSSEQLLRVIYWKREFQLDFGIKQPEWRERNAAIKLLVQLDIALLKAEMMAGVFERNYGYKRVE
jgi:hypothetical protein